MLTTHISLEKYNNLQKELDATKELLLSKRKIITDLEIQNFELISELEEQNKECLEKIKFFKELLCDFIIKEEASEKLSQDLYEAHQKVLAVYRSKVYELTTEIENLKEKDKDREQAHAKAIDLYHNKLDQLKTNELINDRDEKITVLEQEIERLKAQIKFKITANRGSLIGEFKLTSLNDNQSTEYIFLSGAYAVEKLEKIQGKTGNSVTIDNSILNENRDYDLTSDDDIGW